MMLDSHTPDAPLVELTRLRSRQAADGLRFTLGAAGIAARVDPVIVVNGERRAEWAVMVPEDQLEPARLILEEEGPERLAEPGAAPAPGPRPALHWVVGLVVINLLVWLAMEGSGGSESRATLLRFGASLAEELRQGQWWRSITAVFIHIGPKHLLANMATLIIFGPPVLRRWGVGRFYLMYLAAGMAGNWVSFALSPSAAVKAGASGAILGLLGVLAGTRIRQIRAPQPTDPPSRFKTWHIVAMVIAFYGFVVGVGPADHLAHLGGLLAGILFGLFMPDRVALLPRTDRLVSLACGALATGLALAAGLLQYFK